MSCDSEITMTKITGGHFWFVCMCVCREWGRMWPSQRRRWQGFSLQRQARAQHRLKHGRNQRASGDRQHTGVFRMHVCKLVCRVVEEGPVLLFTSDLRTTCLGSCTLCFPVKFKTFRRGEQRWSSVDFTGEATFKHPLWNCSIFHNCKGDFGHPRDYGCWLSTFHFVVIWQTAVPQRHRGAQCSRVIQVVSVQTKTV